MEPDTGKRLDTSVLAIIAGNLVTIILAISLKWQLGAILCVYWFQSVVIGLFNFRRILLLKNFSTEGFTMNDRAVPEDDSGRRSTAFFFLVHYGFFHFGYAVFIAATAEESLRGWGGVAILAGGISFLISHGFSFRKNVAEDLRGRPNIGTMMFMPYLRIIPMHLTIIIGGSVSGSPAMLLFFLVLKTLADVLMHVVEHRLMRKARQDADK